VSEKREELEVKIEESGKRGKKENLRAIEGILRVGT
jgi:hypothetical protein